MRITRLGLKNFLSYRDATLELGDFTVLVGPNASGKSNVVAAFRLLSDVARFNLQTALARLGGFDQVRHRGARGRPYDPAIWIEFEIAEGLPPSWYELRLGSMAGGIYEVKLERGEVNTPRGKATFETRRGQAILLSEPNDERRHASEPLRQVIPPPGMSAIPYVAGYGDLFAIFQLLTSLHVVEMNTSLIRDLQIPDEGFQLAPDGANTASAFEGLDQRERAQLVDQLQAVVPGIIDIEPRRFANKLTTTFTQETPGQEQRRKFLAHQMSDGTLRTFGILLALMQRTRPTLVAIEEPEIAIHVGALRTLVDLLRDHASKTQLLITTHSVDVVDSVDIDQLRVIWAEGDSSHIGRVAKHTKQVLQKGMLTPGELLRSDSLDPSPA